MFLLRNGGRVRCFCLYRCGNARAPDAELPDMDPADLRIDLSARQGRVVSI
ncbi:hypothetical protein ACNKHP_01790 [Shigella boydii]